MSGVVAIANVIPDMGALLSLNLSNCELVTQSSNIDVSTDLRAGELIEHEGKMRPISAQWDSGYRVHILDGIIAVADAISDNGALTKLDIRTNSIPSKQKGELRRVCAAGNIKLTM
jgi:hypothetical protein